MGHRFEVIAPHSLIAGYFFGPVRADDVIASLSSLAVDPCFRPEFDRINLFAPDVDLSDLSPENMKAILAKENAVFGICPIRDDRPVRIAGCNTKALNDTVMRLFGALRDMNPRGEVAGRFDDVFGALCWLDRPDPALASRLCDELARQSGRHRHA